MPPSIGPSSAGLSHSVREALAGELLGAPITVRSAPGLSGEVAGTLVDETLSTFVIRRSGHGRTVRLPKAGLEGTILLPSGELPLKGDALRVRPEDRTKRLLGAGPKRFR